MPALLALVAALLVAAPIAPAPTRWVEDHASFLSPSTVSALDARLEAYEHATGHQVIVWIGTTLDGAALDDWAVRTFAAWRIGRSGIDDGLAIFVFAEDRKIDIEVGYGLEDRVTDAIASRIIHEVMTPKLRTGDRDAAVVAGVDAALAAIEGKPWTGSGTASTIAPRDGSHSWVTWVVGSVVGLALLILFMINPGLALWFLWSILSGGRGGGGGGGGGFGGGGGRSGGGGARGGW